MCDDLKDVGSSVIQSTDDANGKQKLEKRKVVPPKHKPIFTPHSDTGDFIVVINADKVVMTGSKWDKKFYYRHSGYVGGLKQILARKLREKRPDDILRFAVKRMLPKNSLGRRQLKKLKVYAGPDHPHQAQKLEKLEI